MIIDHLHGKLKSLKACSLVCKTWTRSARFHLFSKLTLDGPRAYCLLKSAPAIIPSIRRLRLREQQWEKTLPFYVGFESIRSITFCILYAYCLDAQALSTLYHNFSSAVDVRLEEVRFASAGQLTDFICAFPRLQRLAINGAGPEFPPDSPLPTNINLSPHLRVLELDCIYMDLVLDWFLSLPNRPTLRAVGLHADDKNNVENIARLLSVLENSLESFLVSTAITDEPRWPFDLRHHTRFRSLHVKLNGDSNDAHLVTQMLSQISSSRMEDLVLEIQTTDDNQFRNVEWRQIDTALQHSAFSGLKTVTVRVVQWPFMCDYDPKVVRWIQRRMPGCHARRLLRIYEKGWRGALTVNFSFAVS